jgi:uncharacterized protein (UPF0216 family)
MALCRAAIAERFARVTVAEATDHLNRARDAYNKALKAQEYSVTGPTGGARHVRRPDLDVLAKEVQRWEQRIVSLQRGGARVRRVVPI